MVSFTVMTLRLKSTPAQFQATIGAYLVFRETALQEPREDGALAYVLVSDQNDLEDRVAHRAVPRVRPKIRESHYNLYYAYTLAW